MVRVANQLPSQVIGNGEQLQIVLGEDRLLCRSQ